MAAARPLLHRLRTLPVDLRRITRGLRTEGAGAGREAAAIGVGAFIGCLPFYGFHLLLCAGVGWLLRLNRLKTYLAANISNPFVAPWLIGAEIQTGAWLRRGSFHPLSRSAFEAHGLWTFAGDLLTGSVVIGAVIGGLAAWATYATMRHARADDPFLALVQRAADRYAEASITAWEFARGKLRYDPIYRAVIDDGLLPAGGGTLVDIGCGQGVTLTLLAEARRQAVGTSAQGESSWPAFEQLIGVELRPRVAALARAALGGEAEIITGDVRELGTRRAHAVLLFDILQMIGAQEQEQVVAALAAALEPGGVMLVREADAGAGWRFAAVQAGNRIKAMAFGNFSQRFHARTSDGWLACFTRHGLVADVRPMGHGTPFGNVLIRCHKRAQASGDQGWAGRGAVGT